MSEYTRYGNTVVVRGVIHRPDGDQVAYIDYDVSQWRFSYVYTDFDEYLIGKRDFPFVMSESDIDDFKERYYDESGVTLCE